MIRINFAIRNNGRQLALCFSEKSNRRYKSVLPFLRGNFNAKDWNKAKQLFNSKTPYSEENNRFLAQLRNEYQKAILEKKDISLDELCCCLIKQDKESIKTSLLEFLTTVIEREKKKPTGGCNYECYEKLKKRLCEFEVYLKQNSSKQLIFEDVDEEFCELYARWLIEIRYKNNYEQLIKLFRSLLNKASVDKKINFKISNINEYTFPITDDLNKTTFPDVLTPEELQRFMELDLTKVQGKRSMHTVELYYDYSKLMLSTYMRPCDAILLNQEHFNSDRTRICYIPKKKASTRSRHKAANLPCSKTVLEIMSKYEQETEEGYILPIYSSKKSAGYKKGKEGLLKKFNQQFNVWLKQVSKELNCKIVLDAYVLRHTSISFAINVANQAIGSVAQWAGTSVQMIERHYNNSEINNKNLDIINNIKNYKSTC